MCKTEKAAGTPKKHGTFRTKLFFSVIGCMLLLLVCCWILNNTMLEDYYQAQKKKDLAAMYTEIDTAYQSQSTLSEWTLRMEQINARSNSSILLLDEWMRPIYVSMAGMESDGWGNVRITLPVSEKMENGTYTIQIETKERANLRYLTLIGRLTDGTWCVIRSPLAAISESVAIINRFLIYSGLGAIAVAGIVAFLLARGLTRPIAELGEVVNSLERLDFSKKFTGKSRDEIGELGASVNRVSIELERNLSELKTANAQLQRDNEIKTHQDQLRRDFIANASHELKTPIALIRAYAEGISDDVSSDPESRRYYSEIIQDEAEKMNLLIKKMTSLMQLESGEEELTISRFEITGLISGILRRYSILLDQKKIAVSFRYDCELYCWGDEYFIENVINNYVSNAANHVSAKGEIMVQAQPVTTGGGARVRVTVFNTGDRIADEDLPRIWESFYKVDKARTRAYGGTGLGLSVVAAIMRAHNMPCGVRNEPDGVSFWFELEQA